MTTLFYKGVIIDLDKCYLINILSDKLTAYYEYEVDNYNKRMSSKYHDHMANYIDDYKLSLDMLDEKKELEIFGINSDNDIVEFMENNGYININNCFIRYDSIITISYRKTIDKYKYDKGILINLKYNAHKFFINEKGITEKHKQTINNFYKRKSGKNVKSAKK